MNRNPIPAWLLSAVLLSAPGLLAGVQGVPPQDAPKAPLVTTVQTAHPLEDAAVATITEQRVKEVLTFLSSDALAGRDSPSAGLEVAAEYLQRRFEEAGLKPGGDEGTFFHHYELDGMHLPAEGLSMTFEGEEGVITLKGGDDLRLFRGGSAIDGPVNVLRIHAADPRASALGIRPRGTLPVLVEVDPGSDLWKSCAEARDVLGQPTSAPWLLVRQGLLPKELPSVRLTVPAAQAKKVKLRNVVAIWPGRAETGHVLVSAHYDHVGIGLPRGGLEDTLFNGADDNATGTTALVAVAEALARTGIELPYSVLFVAFSAEEKGLRGSRAYADRPSLPLDQCRVNVNLEMLGRPAQGRQNQAWVTGRDLSDFEARVIPGFLRQGIEVVPFRMHGQLFRQSDNWSLAQKGVVAHSISAGELHADYHGPKDEVDRIDITHMTVVVRGLLRVVLDLSSEQDPPAYNEAGQRATRGTR